MVLNCKSRPPLCWQQSALVTIVYFSGGSISTELDWSVAGSVVETSELHALWRSVYAWTWDHEVNWHTGSPPSPSVHDPSAAFAWRTCDFTSLRSDDAVHTCDGGAFAIPIAERRASQSLDKSETTNQSFKLQCCGS